MNLWQGRGNTEIYWYFSRRDFGNANVGRNSGMSASFNFWRTGRKMFPYLRCFSEDNIVELSKTLNLLGCETGFSAEP